MCQRAAFATAPAVPRHTSTIPVGTGNTIMNTPTIKGSRKIGLIRNGLNAIIKRWLENDCHETPEQMCEILLCEYRGRFDSAGRR